MTAYNAKLAKEQLAKGLCRFAYCKEPHREGKTTCVKHGKMVSEASKKRQKRIKEACAKAKIPICSKCLKENDRISDGFKTCFKCDEKNKTEESRETRKELRDGYKKNGKCSSCGKTRDNENLLTCKKCRTRSPEQKKKKNEACKQDKEFAIKHHKCIGCLKLLKPDYKYKNCKSCRAKVAESARKQRRKIITVNGREQTRGYRSPEFWAAFKQRYTKKPSTV